VKELFVPFTPQSRRRARHAAKPTEAPKRSYPARIARQLALAHSLQGRIDSGEFRNQATLARALGLSRERISKLLGWLLLAPSVQEEVLFLRCAAGTAQPTDTQIHRAVLHTIDWVEQRAAWMAHVTTGTHAR
jgi:hypothetical protein